MDAKKLESGAHYSTDCSEFNLRFLFIPPLALRASSRHSVEPESSREQAQAYIKIEYCCPSTTRK